MLRTSLTATLCFLTLGCTGSPNDVSDVKSDENTVVLPDANQPLPSPEAEPNWPDPPRSDISGEFEAMRDSVAKLMVIAGQTTPPYNIAGADPLFFADETTAIGDTLPELQTDWSTRAQRLTRASDSVETSAAAVVNVVLSRSDSILKDAIETESVRLQQISEQQAWLSEHKPTDPRVARLAGEANQIRENLRRWNELREELSKFPIGIGIDRMSPVFVAYKTDPETKWIGDALEQVLKPAAKASAELTSIKDLYLSNLQQGVDNVVTDLSQVLKNRQQLIEEHKLTYDLLVKIEGGDSSVVDEKGEFQVLKNLVMRVRGKNVRLGSTLIDVVSKYDLISDKTQERLRAQSRIDSERFIVREMKHLLESGPESKAFHQNDASFDDRNGFFGEGGEGGEGGDDNASIATVYDTSIATLENALSDFKEFAAYIRKLQAISLPDLSSAMSLADASKKEHE